MEGYIRVHDRTKVVLLYNYGIIEVNIVLRVILVLCRSLLPTWIKS